ncbi:MAG: hypothetical protein KJ749_06110 [Planctomycetes bacterium]|nr:hypothetical protein [Planctomycetota bacterium]
MQLRPNHPLRRHFQALVEHAFYTEVGLCDPVLTNYVVELLVDFTHVDRLNAIRDLHGKDLDQVAATLLALFSEEPVAGAARDRMMYRHLGDYTLFWAGVYPEQLKRAHYLPTDVLLDYVQRGKRSYAIVSNLASETDAPPSSLFRHLSDDFEFCLYGLGVVRREWENLDPPTGKGGPGLVY